MNSFCHESHATLDSETSNSISGAKSREDKRQISRQFLLKRLQDQLDNETEVDYNELKLSQIKVITSYSDNYTIGRLCESVNRLYCEKHDYEFECSVLSYDDMMSQVYPRNHCTWYKIKLINESLATIFHRDEIENNDQISYILWIDSDAIFINHDVKLDTFIRRGKYKNLIVAEDMNQACLINAGVLLIRVSEWSIQFWHDVWNCCQYHERKFFDQSAIIKVLKGRQEGLNLIHPFHTYIPGNTNKGDKYFPNVTVFPHIDFNSNYGYTYENSRKAMRKFNRTRDKLSLKHGTIMRHEQQHHQQQQLHSNSTNNNSRSNNEQSSSSIVSELIAKCDLNNDSDNDSDNEEEDTNHHVKNSYSSNSNISNSNTNSNSNGNGHTNSNISRSNSSCHEDDEVNIDAISHQPSPYTIDRLSQCKSSMNDTPPLAAAVSTEAQFIFHAAGKCNKIVSLRNMITKHAIAIAVDVPVSVNEE